MEKIDFNKCHELVLAGTENMPGVVDVRFAEREPAEKRSLLSWEQVGRKMHGRCQILIWQYCILLSCVIHLLCLFARKTHVYYQRT